MSKNVVIAGGGFAGISAAQKLASSDVTITIIDKDQKSVHLKNGHKYFFDYLILAPGARYNYFGNDEWKKHAPGLKSISDALDIRERTQHLVLGWKGVEKRYEHILGSNIDSIVRNAMCKITLVKAGKATFKIDSISHISNKYRIGITKELKLVYNPEI